MDYKEKGTEFFGDFEMELWMIGYIVFSLVIQVLFGLEI